MAEIIKFPVSNISFEPSLSPIIPWEDRTLQSLSRDQPHLDEDEDLLSVLSSFEQEVVHPKERRSFFLFLYEQMFDESLSLERRESLAAAVAALFAGTQHNRLLMPKLVLGTKNERLIAALAVGFSGNYVALEPLQTLLMDEDKDLQKAAAFGLSGLKDGSLDDQIVEIFLKHLTPSQDSDVLTSLLVNLKLLARPALEAVFLSFSHHPQREVRITALGGLLFTCASAGLTRAVECLKSSNESIRAIALSVIERHGSRRNMEVILPLMGDAHPRIRQLARETLVSLRERRLHGFVSG